MIVGLVLALALALIGYAIGGYFGAGVALLIVVIAASTPSRRI